MTTRHQKYITFARVTAWGNAPQMTRQSRFAQPTIGSDSPHSSASTRTRNNSVNDTELKQSYWRKLMIASISRLFSWEFIILAFIAFMVIALTGCSVHTFAELGDTSYSASISLEAEKYESID